MTPEDQEQIERENAAENDYDKHREQKRLDAHFEADRKAASDLIFGCLSRMASAGRRPK